MQHCAHFRCLTAGGSRKIGPATADLATPIYNGRLNRRSPKTANLTLLENKKGGKPEDFPPFKKILCLVSVGAWLVENRSRGSRIILEMHQGTSLFGSAQRRNAEIHDLAAVSHNNRGTFEQADHC